jgi:hypothetical protein
MVAFGIETSTRQCCEKKNQCGKQNDGSVLEIMAVSSFSSCGCSVVQDSASRSLLQTAN